MRYIVIILALIIGWSLFVPTSCSGNGASAIATSKQVTETPEDWHIVSPGEPMREYTMPHIVQKGTGEPVQIGDIVTVRKYILTDDGTQVEKNIGTLWFWVGFLDQDTRYDNDTLFYKCDKYSYSCEQESAVIGIPIGSWFYYPIKTKLIKFIDDQDEVRVFAADVMSAGSEAPYMLDPDDTLFSKAPLPSSPPPYLKQQYQNNFLGGGVGAFARTDLFHIEKRCPAQLRQRRVKVAAGGAMKSGNLFDPDITTEERRIWVLEGELVATCADGSQMTYKTGPIMIPPPSGMSAGPATPQGYWDQWFKKAWGKVPKGLRIHPAPTLDTSEPSPDILEKVRAINTRYPKPMDYYNSLPGFAHPPYIVQAGQRTKLDLHAGAASVGGIGGGGSKAVTITGYRMVPDRSHGKLEQDAQGDYYFTADADYQGPAYFYVKLLDKRKGARPTINEAAGVPLQIVSAAKALELQQRKQARQQRHQAIMQLRKGAHTKVDQYFLYRYSEGYKGMNSLEVTARTIAETIGVIDSAVENVKAKRNHPLDRKLEELTGKYSFLQEVFGMDTANTIENVKEATEAVASAQALLNTVQKLNPQSAVKIQTALEHLNHVVVHVKQAKAISDKSQPAKDQLIIVADKALAILENPKWDAKQKGSLLKKLLKIAKVASSHIDTQAEITALKKASEAGKHVAPLFKEAETILQADMHARIKAATAQEKADMLAGK